MTHLQSPWFALLLLPLVAAVVVAVRRQPPALRVSHAGPFAAATRGWRWWHPVRLPVFIAAAGLALLVIALMRPQHGIEMTIQRTEGIDIVVVLDVSGSMRAFDIPASVQTEAELARGIQNGEIKCRVDIAKEELRKFVEKRPNDRIGLIVFSKVPYVVCPPTLDRDFMLNHLQTLQAGSLPDGTGLAAPLSSATTRLKDSKAKRRVVVLFTDGMNNVEAQITPHQAAKLARTFDVTVHTVGVGSQRAVVIASGWFGQSLQLAREAGLDEALLKEIADSTGGRYFRARDAEGFAEVMREIDALEKTEIEAPRYVDYRERFYPWLLAGAALLLLGFFLENTILMTAP
jgi:Ca-activated chloride channel family protein